MNNVRGGGRGRGGEEERRRGGKEERRRGGEEERRRGESRGDILLVWRRRRTLYSHMQVQPRERNI